MQRFVAASAALRIGSPFDERTDLGHKVSLPTLATIARCVQQAVADGAQLALGGHRPAQPPTPGGYWFSPTVLTQVDPAMEVMRREIFGPVLPIVAFDRFDDALRIVNDSRYGLSAYLFTNDMPTIMRAVTDVGFGEVYVNRVGPESLQGFHGGYGDSGLGGDDGAHGLEAYLRKKTVYLNYSGRATVPLMPYRP